jgi:hypothetical protein
MTPLFLRVSVLVMENVITYTEFLNMEYLDFKRFEAVWSFKNKQIKSKASKQDTAQVRNKLAGVPARSVANMGFSEDQLKGIFSES